MTISNLQEFFDKEYALEVLNQGCHDYHYRWYILAHNGLVYHSHRNKRNIVSISTYAKIKPFLDENDRFTPENE